ncbi:MAG: RagB/SusD family nutrient uptake outer membrane protein, partial [Gemmatimonadota bacterium]|nr:RagB/SusD family nutrient uptake outer membrane protein [Gemmatimonadota bacterium]
YMGMAFCEGPAAPSGAAVTDMQLVQQAVTKFTDAIQTANAAGRADFAMAAQAGRAQAQLVLGDLAAAASDAAAIPDGFSYDAVFNVQNTNSVVQLTTKTYNEAAGLMYVWWPQMDLSTSSGFMRDPWTDVPDPRIPVFFDGEVATDNETPHYSQWKYNQQTDDIPMVHSDLMRLIEAENLAAQSDFPGAMLILNTLRANVGLAALPAPADAAEMQQYLLSERFAELFMEGQRMVDLHRFDMVDDVFGPLADSERPAAGRPTKFSMTQDEAVVNANIQNDLTSRCLPKA